jgi:hypothetical protein
VRPARFGCTKSVYVSLAVCIGTLTDCHHTLRSANGVDVVSGEPDHELVVTTAGVVVDVRRSEQIVCNVAADVVGVINPV